MVRYLQVRATDKFRKQVLFHVRAGSALARYIVTSRLQEKPITVPGILPDVPVTFEAGTYRSKIVTEQQMHQDIKAAEEQARQELQN
jgi:hypothetical protein